MKSKLLRLSLFLLILFGIYMPVAAQEALWKEQSPWEGVPEYYQKWNYPDFQFPSALTAWKNDRVQVAATLQRLLGDIPDPSKESECKNRFQKADEWICTRKISDR